MNLLNKYYEYDLKNDLTKKNKIIKDMENLDYDINAHDINGDTMLHTALYHENEFIVRFLLKNGANPNIFNITILKETPLHIAIRKQNYKIVNLLLQYNADPNIKNYENDAPLHLAAYNDNNKIIELLLKYGADKNITNGNKLSYIQILQNNPYKL